MGGREGCTYLSQPCSTERSDTSLLIREQLQHTLNSRARVIQKEVVQKREGGMEGGGERKAHLSLPAVQYRAMGYLSLSLSSSNTRLIAGPE